MIIKLEYKIYILTNVASAQINVSIFWYNFLILIFKIKSLLMFRIYN